MSDESVTPDLVEFVRRAYEACNQRDFNYVEIDEARAAAERLAEERR